MDRSAWILVALASCASAPPPNPPPPSDAPAASVPAPDASAAASSRPPAPAAPIAESTPTAPADPDPDPSPLPAVDSPPTAMDRFARALRSQARACYGRALYDDPTIQGSMSVSADPSADKCRFVHIKVETTGFPATLTSCIRKAVTETAKSFDACAKPGMQPITAPLQLAL